jgi:hypothetical protein
MVLTEMLIGGGWRPAAGIGREDVTSPYDGPVVGTVPTADEVRAALATTRDHRGPRWHG